MSRFTVVKLEMDQVTGGEVETHIRDFLHKEDAVSAKDCWNKIEGNAYCVYVVKEVSE